MSDWLNEQTRASLLARLKDPGDAHCWSEFVGRYEPEIRLWCKRHGLNSADADDVTGAVLLKLTTALPRFEYDPARGFRRWLRVVVRNAVHDLFGDRTRQLAAAVTGGTSVYQRLLEQPDAVAELADTVSAVPSEQEALLMLVLDELRRTTAANQWQAFWRTEMEQQSVAEAAQALGMTQAAVYQARYRLKKKIAEQMTALEQDES
jgi:RNA polymerase sigma-70 factor (ECF subfamily)